MITRNVRRNRHRFRTGQRRWTRLQKHYVQYKSLRQPTKETRQRPINQARRTRPRPRTQQLRQSRQLVRYTPQRRPFIKNQKPQSIQNQKPQRTSHHFNIDAYTCSIESDLSKIGRPNGLLGTLNIDFGGPSLNWPEKLTPIFAISLRVHRYIDLQTRMRRWSSLVQLVPATDGSKVTYKVWRKQGRLVSGLTRGQIGCYESHARIWNRIVQSNLPHALVLEDDADISYSQETVNKLNTMLDELQTQHDWDVLYVGNIGLHPIKRKVTPHLNEPSGWEGLYTYFITQAGARKLLKNAFPIAKPVDIFVGDEARKGNLKLLAMSPPLNFVVPVKSDTDVKI